MSAPVANSHGSGEKGAAQPSLLAGSATTSVNADNPWLGLASFTEDTRGYFYGREQEITELERRVQRKLLTVLFGKSGLGKTSILQAGLVPGLRARGYFPVYLRIDYGHDSPEPAEQIKQAINKAAAAGLGVVGTGGSAGAHASSAASEIQAAGATGGINLAAGQSTVRVATAGQGASPASPAAPATPALTLDPEESIWEFLHHREVPQASGAVAGDVSAETRTVKSHPAPLIPLLIFDQFEEIFTLAQSDEFGRARAARFVEELADLVENRPPKALEAKLDSDDSIAERFDFARSDYRVVISLREDYLAPLESLKKQMPSLSQNRLRLAPMTGSQALEAVLLPGQRLAEDSVLPGQRPGAGAAQVSGRPLEAGGQLGARAAGPPGAGTPLEPEMAQVTGRPPRPGRALVTEEVAEAIVRFVAGGAELANAEVEPSLLSLICRELNEQRLAQDHSEISLGLLAGSRESILSSFYERALADQPPAVRSLIEDELLTESGYRENLAEESLLRKLQTAGAAPDALAKLVNRRLLRIEERLDVRRVELTHDVLTGVVKASRDQRHEREAHEATERLLAEQAARESAARRALRRARAIAAGCTALAAAAVIAALFAVVNVQRARHAEADARQTRTISEQARQQAEGLLGFLTDDFVRELETFGRYQTIADLSQREIDYFRALPPQLKDPASIRNGALALEDHAGASDYSGDFSTAARNAVEAVALLESLRRTDPSDATTVALARAYGMLGSARHSAGNEPEAIVMGRREIALSRPIAAGSSAESVEAQRAELAALTSLGLEESNAGQYDGVVRDSRQALRLARQLGAPDHADVTVDTDYASAGSFLAFGLADLGRDDESRQAAEESLAVVDRIVVQRPQYGDALRSKLYDELQLTAIALGRLDPSEAAHFGTQGLQTATTLIGIEPNNRFYLNVRGLSYAAIADSMWQAGHLREAVVADRKAIETLGQAGAGGGIPLDSMMNILPSTGSRQARLGDFAAAATTLAAADAFLSPGTLRRLGVAGSTEVSFRALRAVPEATVAYERGDFGAARRLARTALAPLQAHPASGGPEPMTMNRGVCYLSTVEGRAEYALGDFTAAVQAEGVALRACQGAGDRIGVPAERATAPIATWLSMALAREGKREEAARTIGPVVTLYRTLATKNHGDQWLPLELAEALYAQSLTDDAHRAALLREAAQRVEHLVPTIAALHDTREWRTRIEAAQRTASGEVRR